ncbi:uncharacterized protein TRAVEDRAFT_47284 [Trametes versicolor FP-101664 SS1]|uniref:uncharacterized protein n=1 Tax=Trametes versicolor (strain FP-101664) TaxID=717944 RepID=UPI0004622C83|nr:uncharacterized protein TRAVEDRAFT_47284 [Trametes versicolor FP-101664 SS1]EIW58106.1 hypothetical protein TRAVEDRAFT_47284 [Trametes versicolor FP-101664 SS1]
MTEVEHARDGGQPDVSLQGNQLPEQTQLSTPPGDLNGADSKISRKREREVSLEPATPLVTTVDVEAGSVPERKDHRVPAKKNRTSAGALEATEEETEEETALSGSPPHETKIRQISQGVEDITWQNMKKDSPPESELQMEEDTAVTPPDEDATVEDAVEPTAEQEETPVEDVKTDAQDDVQVPPLLQGENPPILNDMAGDEDSGAAAGAEFPAGSHVPGAPEPSTLQASGSQAASVTPTDTQPELSPRLPPQRRGSDSDQEKGLKRKLGDRTVSERLLPGEKAPSRSGTPPVTATKRLRDDNEADPNTREKKRPTPPPEEDEKKEPKAAAPVAAPSAQRFGGFMAYASTSSPFASVNGPKVFGSKQSSPSPWAASATQSTSPFASSSASPFAATVKDTDSAASSSSSSPQKRTGFEAFASATSPFASAAKRPKSPPPPSSSSSVLGRSRSPSRHGTPARASNAFSAYATGGTYGFGAASNKRRSGSSTPALGESSNTGALAESAAEDTGKDDDSEKDSGVSFGERLREAKDKDSNEASDDEKKLNLTEQEVHTGEEEEDTVYQVRGKLFTLSPQNQWKEKGTGTLRLNVRREDGGGARLVMRKEAVYTVLLNATLFKGMRCFPAQDPRYIRFSVINGAATTHYNLRVSSAKIAEELLEEINAHIPNE